jgi:hypothetical protein
MKITFTTSPKNFEYANYVLGQALAQLEVNPILREGFGLTEKQVKAAMTFRKSVVKGFLDAAKGGQRCNRLASTSQHP